MVGLVPPMPVETTLPIGCGFQPSTKCLHWKQRQAQAGFRPPSSLRGADLFFPVEVVVFETDR